MNSWVAILGAGMVGVATALELQRPGAQVILVERRGPGQETSCGNAGAIARSTLMPFAARAAALQTSACWPKREKAGACATTAGCSLPQPGRRNLWPAFGHQHVGFSTGTGTAKLLGALMTGSPVPINANLFRAKRFL